MGGEGNEKEILLPDNKGGRGDNMKHHINAKSIAGFDFKVCLL